MNGGSLGMAGWLLLVTGAVLLAAFLLLSIPGSALAAALNRAGAGLGWMFYRGAMQRLQRDRQLEALHALILTSYVQSGDVGGLAQYINQRAPQLQYVAGQMIPVYVPESSTPVAFCGVPGHPHYAHGGHGSASWLEHEYIAPLREVLTRLHDQADS
jgi:hypothetical protein